MAGEKPYVANGSTSDPREQICWDFYIESITKGEINATESALKAGYSKDHARNITMQGWFKERLEELERKEMLSKAEKVLMKTLNYSTEEVDDEGRIKVKVDLLRVQLDASKHLTSTLGKNKGYSTRSEVTGADGKDLIPDEESKKRSEDALSKYLNK